MPYPFSRNIFPRSSTDGGGGNTNIKSVAEKAQSQEAESRAMNLFGNWCEHIPSFGSPLWDEKCARISEEITKLLEKKNSGVVLTKEEELSLAKERCLEKLVKSALEKFRRRDLIIELAVYELDVLRKMSIQKEHPDIGSRTNEFYILKSALQNKESNLASTIEALKKGLSDKRLSKKRKQEIQGTINSLIGAMPKAVEKEMGEISGPFSRTPLPEKRSAFELWYRAARREHPSFADDFWLREEERLAKSIGFSDVSGKELAENIHALREEFGERDRKIKAIIDEIRHKRITETNFDRSSRHDEARIIGNILYNPTTGIGDSPEKAIAELTALIVGVNSERGIGVSNTRAKEMSQRIHRLEAIFVPQEQPKDEIIPAISHEDDDDLDGWKIFGDEITETKARPLALSVKTTPTSDGIPRPKEVVLASDVLEMGESADDEDESSVFSVTLKPKISVSVTGSRGSASLMGKEDEPSASTDIDDELPEGAPLPLEDISDNKKERIINIEDLIERGKNEAKRRIIDSKEDSEHIAELIGGLLLIMEEKLELLKLHSGAIIDVSSYVLPFSTEGLCKKIEEDSEKIREATDAGRLLEQKLFVLMKNQKNEADFNTEKNDLEQKIKIAKELPIFNTTLPYFLRIKAQHEALVDYLLSKPIPIHDAEGYLGVSPYADRKAVDLAHAQLLQGLDVEKNAREITALHEARRKALIRVEREEKEAEERQKALDAVHIPEGNKTKDLTEILNQKLPARRWWGMVPWALAGIGTAIAVAFGVQKADEMFSARPVAEPQTHVMNIPKPEAPSVIAPKIIEAAPIVIERSVAEPEVSVPSATVHVEQVTPIMSTEPAAPKIESLTVSRDFTAHDLSVESGDTVDDILHSAFKAHGVSFEKTSQMIKNFVYHQVLTENRLTERKGKNGIYYVDIAPGQLLSLEGLQDTLETLEKKAGGTGKVEPVEQSVSQGSTSSNRQSTALSEGSGAEPIISGNPRLTKEGVGGGESIAIEQTSSRPQSPESSSSSLEKGYDIHVMKKWETVWKIIHNKLRERGLNWTSERINFLTQIVLDDNAENFRTLVASGQMKAMKDTAIPEGATIDFTLASSIMDQMKTDRDTKGKSMSVKEMAGIYGKKYPISLTFPS